MERRVSTAGATAWNRPMATAIRHSGIADRMVGDAQGQFAGQRAHGFRKLVLSVQDGIPRRQRGAEHLLPEFGQPEAGRPRRAERAAEPHFQRLKRLMVERSMPSCASAAASPPLRPERGNPEKPDVALCQPDPVRHPRPCVLKKIQLHVSH